MASGRSEFESDVRECHVTVSVGMVVPCFFSFILFGGLARPPQKGGMRGGAAERGVRCQQRSRHSSQLST